MISEDQVQGRRDPKSLFSSVTEQSAQLASSIDRTTRLAEKVNTLVAGEYDDIDDPVLKERLQNKDELVRQQMELVKSSQRSTLTNSLVLGNTMRNCINVHAEVPDVPKVTTSNF